MHKRFLHHLQFIFQENNSVVPALISMTEEMWSSLDNRRFGCGIFVDLKKAFDTVNHSNQIRALWY